MKILLLALLLGVLYGCSDSNTTPTETLYDYGRVVVIDQCRAGKYSYNCAVVTIKYSFDSLDISDYPDESLSVGDNISRKRLKTDNKIVSYKCKNNKCSAIGICYWWMPCYK